MKREKAGRHIGSVFFVYFNCKSSVNFTCPT
jgi:hypothetical protein